MAKMLSYTHLCLHPLDWTGQVLSDLVFVSECGRHWIALSILRNQHSYQNSILTQNLNMC